MKPIVFYEYQPKYKQQFAFLKDRYNQVLNNQFEIKHIGSTSIENLGGKNIIDIAILFQAEKQFNLIHSKLSQLGYTYEGEKGIKDRHAFRLATSEIPHHLYVCKKDSNNITNMIMFRDYLRNHSIDRVRYQELKRQLSIKYQYDRNGYTDAKTEFIQDILKKAGESMREIILAGGCFWGVEAYYKQLKGITRTRVGYTDGTTENPTYQDLIHHKVNHVEAIKIQYDESVITLDTILEHLFRFIDPTSLNKQGGDIGIQYRTGIYYATKEEQDIAESFIKKQQALYQKPIVVEVKPQTAFYDAEEYHQDYLTKNPSGYCHIDLSLAKDEEKK